MGVVLLVSYCSELIKPKENVVEILIYSCWVGSTDKTIEGLQ